MAATITDRGLFVAGSRGLRAGRSYRATLRWREGGDRHSMTTRLYVHRRFPGGRG